MFCFSFTLLCAFITFLFLDWGLFVEALGSLAVMFEAMLGFPQLLQNYNNHSTRGMSVCRRRQPSTYHCSDVCVSLPGTRSQILPGDELHHGPCRSHRALLGPDYPREFHAHLKRRQYL
ncbi:hypothetical protein DNTS_009283 [Danionella cerebrum]|uniref:Uncharacterized protein n=1 Tax=Danionella cerebrum TaxID=2873325 RepID=A0A553Q5S2_9TELE|nr:hypothetical protein DNTS_009283 [Danionella translucida]